MGSAAALADPGYELDHNAIFSTGFLRDYFRDQGIGVYRPEGPGKRAPRSSTMRSPRRPRSPPASFRAGPAPAPVLRAPEARRTQPLRAGDHGPRPGDSRWPFPGLGPGRDRERGRDRELTLPQSKARLRMLPRVAQREYADHATPVRRRPALMYPASEPGPPRDGSRRARHRHQHLREQGPGFLEGDFRAT